MLRDNTPMKKTKLVMVGNGMAGVRTLEELLKIAPEMYDITVFGAEPHPNYNRILLSPVLAGEQTLDEIVLNPLSWYAGNGITLRTGTKVTQIDRIKRVVRAADGSEAPYDRLLLATGSHPFILPVPGKDLPGVIAYRDIADTQAMIDAATKYKHAVVIGGGLLGLEAANGLMLRGMTVTVVHIMPWLMERQLDDVAARLLQKSLEDRGLKFMMGAQTQALVAGDSGRVASVQFKDGTQVPADLVVMAAGIRPNTDLAEACGLHCARGVVVNDTMQTITDPRIYSVGECAAHRGIAYGLVAPLFEQAKVAANHLAQHGIGRYTGSLTSTKLKVTGIDLFSAGDLELGRRERALITADAELREVRGAHLRLLEQRRHEAVGDTAVCRAFADRIDARVGDGLHRVVDDDAAVAVQADLLGECGVGADAGGHHDQIGGYFAAVLEADRPDAPVLVAEQGFGVRTEQEREAALLQRGLQQFAGDIVELPIHQPRREVHHADLHAAQHQAVRGFEPQQTAADDDGVPVFRGRLDHRVGVVDVAVGDHALQIPAGHGRDERVRAGGDEQPVVGFDGAVFGCHGALGAADVHHLLAQVQGDAVVRVPAQRVQHDLVQRLLAGEHRAQQDAVVVRVRLGTEDRDVVQVGRDLDQLLERAYTGHAVADHHQFHLLHR